MLLIKWRYLHFDGKNVALALFASYSTWLLGWVGTGSFLQGDRALIALICFMLALSLTLAYEKLHKPLVKGIKRRFLIAPLVLIVLGFVANFTLPFKPVLMGEEGESYKYPTYSQGGFSDYVLNAIAYVSLHTTFASPPFLCLNPYITFGLCDLMWQTPKIPKHASITPEMVSPSAIIELFKDYLGKNVIVPQCIHDRLLATQPMGYHSLYKKPFQFLLSEGVALVYSNGLYAIFLI